MKNGDNMISIVTATYNRGKKIKKLYDSLVQQTNKNFEWIIIDDGSIDNTKYIVENFILENKIKIYYFVKENGGKHTAINYILDKNEFLKELVFFVDSDDYLINDAIANILSEWKNIQNKNQFCGLCFQRIDIKTNKIITKKFPENRYDANIFTLIKKDKIYGDKAEIFLKDELIKWRFPEIKGEKFFSELYVWIEVMRNKKMRFINKGIYFCEYLNDGYTKNFNTLLKNNPIGCEMYYKKMIKEKRLGMIFRLKSLYRLFQVYFMRGKK